MGTFKVNGTDIKAIAEVISTSDARAKSAFFSSGKVLVSGLSDSSKTLANAPESKYANWGLHNIVGDKLLVNGVADTVARLGTRPNFASLTYLGGESSGNTVQLKYDKSTDTLKLQTTSDPVTVIYSATGKSVVVFELVGAGGGAGGGNVNFWGGATGGGGGGGGCSILGIIDMNLVPNSTLTIRVGTGGYGGGGKSAGGAGGASTISCSGYTSFTAGGGSGGAAGRPSDGSWAPGGEGGTYSVGNIPGVRYIYLSSGERGGNSTAAGGSSDSTTLKIPMDAINITSTGKTGGSGGGTNGGGGGGASGSTIYGSCAPGKGGADRNNGSSGAYVGAGGGGGGAHFSGGGQSGGAGSVGAFRIFY